MYGIIHPQSPAPTSCLGKISRWPSTVGLYADVRLLQLARFDEHDEGVDALNERNLNDFSKYLFSGNDNALTDTQQPLTLQFFVSSLYVVLALGADVDCLVRGAR